MPEIVHAELIDRNKLVSELLSIKVDVTGMRHGRYIEAEVERFIREEIVQTVREMPYVRV